MLFQRFLAWYAWRSLQRLGRLASSVFSWRASRDIALSAIDASRSLYCISKARSIFVTLLDTIIFHDADRRYGTTAFQHFAGCLK